MLCFYISARLLLHIDVSRCHFIFQPDYCSTQTYLDAILYFSQTIAPHRRISMPFYISARLLLHTDISRCCVLYFSKTIAPYRRISMMCFIFQPDYCSIHTYLDAVLYFSQTIAPYRRISMPCSSMASTQRVVQQKDVLSTLYTEP